MFFPHESKDDFRAPNDEPKRVWEIFPTVNPADNPIDPKPTAFSRGTVAQNGNISKAAPRQYVWVRARPNSMTWIQKEVVSEKVGADRKRKREEADRRRKQEEAEGKRKRAEAYHKRKQEKVERKRLEPANDVSRTASASDVYKVTSHSTDLFKQCINDICEELECTGYKVLRPEESAIVETWMSVYREWNDPKYEGIPFMRGDRGTFLKESWIVNLVGESLGIDHNVVRKHIQPFWIDFQDRFSAPLSELVTNTKRSRDDDPAPAGDNREEPFQRDQPAPTRRLLGDQTVPACSAIVLIFCLIFLLYRVFTRVTRKRETLIPQYDEEADLEEDNQA